MNKSYRLFCILISLVFTSFASYKPFYSDTVSNWQAEIPEDTSELVYSVYLIGDARCAYSNESLLNMIKTQISGAGKNSAVVFLGDNVHPQGLPDPTHRLWDIAQKSLSAQLELVQDFRGEIIFIPGNHDWANGKREGLEYIKNQRKYIEDYLDRKHVFLPEKADRGQLKFI